MAWFQRFGLNRKPKLRARLQLASEILADPELREAFKVGFRDCQGLNLVPGKDTVELDETLKVIRHILDDGNA